MRPLEVRPLLLILELWLGSSFSQHIWYSLVDRPFPTLHWDQHYSLAPSTLYLILLGGREETERVWEF